MIKISKSLVNGSMIFDITYVRDGSSSNMEASKLVLTENTGIILDLGSTFDTPNFIPSWKII